MIGLVASLVFFFLVCGIVEALNIRALRTSLRDGVASVPNGTVNKAEHPNIFKAYVAIQIGTVIFIPVLLIAAVVFFVIMIPRLN